VKQNGKYTYAWERLLYETGDYFVQFVLNIIMYEYNKRLKYKKISKNVEKDDS